MEPLRAITSQNKMVWMTQPREDMPIMQRTTNALAIAQGKFEESNGNTELVIQTAEAFGRGIFADSIAERSSWTMKDWIETISRDILNPLGIGATITTLSNDTIHSQIFRMPLHEDANDQHLASLFTYGFLRGLLCSAFPDGEVIMKNSMAAGAPMTGFVFKLQGSEEDQLERQKMSEQHSTMKKE